jgi:hypothetical protein
MSERAGQDVADFANFSQVSFLDKSSLPLNPSSPSIAFKLLDVIFLAE